jgi:hypothetical protein
VLWQGNGIFTGFAIQRVEDGSCILRFPDGRYGSIGNFLRVEAPDLDEVEVEPRDSRLSVRLTGSEYDTICAKAERCGLPLSDYVRHVLTVQP